MDRGKPFDYLVPVEQLGPRTFVCERHRHTGVSRSTLVIQPDGAPVLPGGSLVRCSRRDSPPGSYDVETLYEVPGADGDGPPRVTTDAYRAGWDLVWGKGGDA